VYTNLTDSMAAVCLQFNRFHKSTVLLICSFLYISSEVGRVQTVEGLLYGLDDWGSIPGKGKIFSLYHRVQTGSEAHPASYPLDTRSPFPDGKAPARESNHSLPSSAVDKNAWSFTSTPTIHIHGVMLS